MNSIKAACKTYLVIGSLIFGMLFGAGVEEGGRLG